jgi:hypothetical protein
MSLLLLVALSVVCFSLTVNYIPPEYGAIVNPIIILMLGYLGYFLLNRSLVSTLLLLIMLPTSHLLYYGGILPNRAWNTGQLL